MSWITKAEAILKHGLMEHMIEDAVAAGLLIGVKFGHRTTKYDADDVAALSRLLPRIMPILERLSRENPQAP